MERATTIGLTSAGVVAGALTIAVIVRLVNRRHDRGDGALVLPLLRAAAKWFKGTSWRQLSRQGRVMYVSGLVLSVAGVALMLSTFAILLTGFGTSDHFQVPGPAQVFRAFVGLILVIMGRFALYLATIEPDR